MPDRRILMVTRNFPPLIGGMERLMLHVYRELSRDFEVAVVGPTGAADYAAGTVYPCPPAPLVRFFPVCVLQTRRAARRLRPDLVFAGSGLTAFPAELGAPRSARLCYVHGLDLVAPHPVYQRMFVPALSRCATVIANSGPTAALARAKGVSDDRLTVLHPGVELPLEVDDHARRAARSLLGLGEHQPVLIAVGRLTARKGLLEFIEQVLRGLVARFPGLVLLVAGADPKGVVRGADMGARIVSARDRLGLRDAVRLLGPVDDTCLDLVYRAANLHVFPGLAVAHDVEGFGMVALEAAAHGVPTVAFDVGGVRDAVAHELSGWLVAAGDYAGFRNVLTDYLSGGRTIDAARCRGFAAGFCWGSFGARLRAICSETIERCRSASSSRSASL